MARKVQVIDVRILSPRCDTRLVISCPRYRSCPTHIAYAVPVPVTVITFTGKIWCPKLRHRVFNRVATGTAVNSPPGRMMYPLAASLLGARHSQEVQRIDGGKISTAARGARAQSYYARHDAAHWEYDHTCEKRFY